MPSTRDFQSTIVDMRGIENFNVSWMEIFTTDSPLFSCLYSQLFLCSQCTSSKKTACLGYKK